MFIQDAKTNVFYAVQKPVQVHMHLCVPLAAMIINLDVQFVVQNLKEAKQLDAFAADANQILNVTAAVNVEGSCIS